MTEEERREQKHRQDLERLQKLRPIDDDFMRCLFKDNLPLLQMVLRIITRKKPDLVLTKSETQKDMKRLGGARSIELDVFGSDLDRSKYDLETERSDKRADPHRVRYHASVVDVESLDAGQDFKELPDSFIIFLTEKDFFGEGKPVYVIERMNLTTGKPFGGGSHILYVNGEYRGDTELGKLMHDFSCTDAKDMNFELIAERTRYLKENPKGVSEMCKLMEDMRHEEREEGRAEGRAEGIKIGEERGVTRGKLESMTEAARRMLAAGKYALGEIADMLGMSPDEVEKLQAGQAAPGV